MSSSPSPPAEEERQQLSRGASSTAASPSVRVRRARAATVAMPALSTITSNQVADTPALEGFSAVAAEGASSPTGRRRRGTITERLFASEGYFQVGDEPIAGSTNRARSMSQTSRASSGRQAVDINIPGEKRRRPSMTSSQGRVDDEHHHEEEVQVLDVLDTAVSTTAHLSNIQSAFWPNAFTRQPVVELEPATPPEKAEPALPGSTAEDLRLLGDEHLEEEDPLGAHLRKVMKREKRKEKFRETMRGVWAFLKTPLGVFAAIYMLLVVVWGAGLVFLLIIPMNSYIKKLWVEIASQILTGLFTITSLLPLPWRTIDWVNVFTILHYARITQKRRKQRGLPPLRDPNDLPEAADAEYWVGVGGEKMTGPRSKPMVAAHPKKSKSKGDKTVDTGPSTPKEEAGVELGAMEGKTCSAIEEALDDESPVLNEKEQHNLHRAQLHFSRSQTYYRAHTTPTHHAFPLWPAFGITALMIGNSVFQAMLCGVMWGMNRFDRPAWTTGCLIPLSFGCMIGASIMIWIYGERTKRKDEVSAKVWQMLKQDEADLEKRRKAAIAKRVAEKEAKKHHHHAQPATIAPAPAPVRF